MGKEVSQDGVLPTGQVTGNQRWDLLTKRGKFQLNFGKQGANFSSRWSSRYAHSLQIQPQHIMRYAIVFPFERNLILHIPGRILHNFPPDYSLVNPLPLCLPNQVLQPCEVTNQDWCRVLHWARVWAEVHHNQWAEVLNPTGAEVLNCIGSAVLNSEWAAMQHCQWAEVWHCQWGKV